jgi:hypothetical protein
MSVPTLAFRSPHIKVVSCGFSPSNTLSSREVAWVSVMSRRVNDDVGGRYTFTMLMRWLFGRISLVRRQYSLPNVDSTFNDFLMYVAMPPLVPCGRRCSTNVYPFISGGSACSATHVSYTHRTSTSCCSNIAMSLRYVSPRTFILPTVIPYVVHLCIILGLLLYLRLDPLFLFIYLLDDDGRFDCIF